MTAFRLQDTVLNSRLPHPRHNQSHFRGSAKGKRSDSSNQTSLPQPPFFQAFSVGPFARMVTGSLGTCPERALKQPM